MEEGRITIEVTIKEGSGERKQTEPSFVFKLHQFNPQHIQAWCGPSQGLLVVNFPFDPKREESEATEKLREKLSGSWEIQTVIVTFDEKRAMKAEVVFLDTQGKGSKSIELTDFQTTFELFNYLKYIAAINLQEKKSAKLTQ